MGTHATDEFFDELSRRAYEPRLASVTGTVRFDIVHDDGTDHRLLVIDHGAVRVSRDETSADCVVRADAALFDAIFSGKANGLSAFLRGAATVEGDPELLVLTQRLVPGLPGRRGDRQPAATGGPQ
jgi:putative sterol carrier protein